MGQKVHPIGLRVGIIEDWRSKWFSQKNYAKWLHEDLRIRAFVKEKLKATGISRVEIERAAEKVKVSVHTAKPGIIIGKKGAGVDDLRREIQGLTALLSSSSAAWRSGGR
jgi:small subunit ribosomal protein S3